MAQTGMDLAPIGEEEVLSHQQQQINNISVASQITTGGLLKPNPGLINGPREDYLKIGVPLYQAAIKCNWNAAKAIIDADKRDLVTYSITENEETALHIAASAKGDPKVVKEFVKNLVDLMKNEDLGILNKGSNTALNLAAAAGNVEAVKIMAEKNKILLTIPNDKQMLPLYSAALFGKYEVVKYLYKESKNLSDDCWDARNRGWLLQKCVENDMFDIALQIVTTYPTLTVTSNGTIILGILARKPKAFDETKPNMIMRTIRFVFTFIGSKVGAHEKVNQQALPLLRATWKHIAIKSRKEIDDILRGPLDLVEQDKSAPGRMLQAIQLQEFISQGLDKMKEETENIIKGQHDSSTTDTNLNIGEADRVQQLKGLISEFVVNMHSESQKIVEQEKTPVVGKRDQALELQKLIFKLLMDMHDETQKILKKEVRNKDHLLKELIYDNINKLCHPTYPKAYSSRVLFMAAEMGNTKFLVELIHQYPDLIWKVDDNNLSIFHIAVKYRHEDIYNLLYEIGAMKDLITPLRDRHDNNMLHLVGRRAQQKQLKDVSGVALQMQRELLWFREVEKMIPPSYRKRKNRDGLTPQELFTIEHKELASLGEKWMKGTASQCMVVAALIATIVFAAAFTVPGGYDQNNGIPVFHSKATFMVFVVADAISLIASSASIFIFLSILTSRYAEGDFLESLPKKLIFGLLTLFLSITTMTLAFVVSFFVLYHKGLLWMPILICVFGVFPVVLYIYLQIGLFYDVLSSTYHSRYLFEPKKRTLYYENPKV